MDYRKTRRILARIMTVMLSAAMVFTMMPLAGTPVYGEDSGTLETQTPVLAVTGTGLLDDGVYSAENVSRERSYSLAELKAMAEDKEYIYSAKKQKDPFTKSYHVARGVELGMLIDGLAERSDRISAIANDGYVSTFRKDAVYHNVPNDVYGVGSLKTKALDEIEPAPGFDQTRYWYDNFDEAAAEEVPAIIAWNYTEDESVVPPSAGDTDKNLRLYVGQLGGEGYDGPEDMNGPLLNGGSKAAINKVAAGNLIEEVALTVGSNTYTRADVLMMPFADASYTYLNSKNVEITDFVRGVPMSVLLDGYNDTDVVTFSSADDYPVKASGYTVKQLIDNDYMLAYEAGSSASEFAGVYDTAKNDPSIYGFFRLYGADENGKPAKLINNITVTAASGEDFSNSSYKHITNGGLSGQDGPYKIDAITGATLTIEGPGMTTSTPLSVKDLENKDNGCFRGNYTDIRNDNPVERTYEGIDLYFILSKLEGSGIKMTDKAAKVTIKNRNRQPIATFNLADVEAMSKAGTPALVAYGTSYTDGTNIRPFVFDGGTGRDPDLGNEDGCLKFVYDIGTYGDQGGKYQTFGNMAYIYVEEESTPGFKHDKSPYDKPENSRYVLTVTGDEIGCEINYTVDQLEKLVKYDDNGDIIDNGYGYRDEYSLANSSYWYVNSYEGVKLWSLLLHSGISADRASDEDTKVTFRATDNYTGFDTFSLAEVADPDRFGFYEKNANDKNDGTYIPNENIRQGTDVTTGDKLAVGYPILVSYGVNEYPFVISKDLDGFLSGLSNDGGPLRVISGKRNYNHANGSNQAKLLDKIIVGDNTYNYSTHTYQPDDSPYKALENSGLTVTVDTGSKVTTKEYTAKDLEELLYGGSLNKTQLAEAKVKDFYEVQKNGSFYSDLYEGVNLNFFLTEVVKLAGSQGTITFKSGDESAEPLVMKLEDVLKITDGYNKETDLSGLTPVIAYAKNGYPLVAGKNDAGYVKSQTLKGITADEVDSTYTVQNNGGPLQLVFPRADADAAATLGSLSDITSIEISLEADKYAHISAPYDTYAENTLTIAGEGTRLTQDKTFTVAELEGNQSLVLTADYSFMNKSGTVSQQRYRGINLYSFLKSTNVGLKPNADKVLVYADGVSDPYEFSLSQISKANYINSATGADDLKVILAYGSAAADNTDVKDGMPLVPESSSDGYVAAYGNDGGPLKLIIGQKDAEDVNKSNCVKNVIKIEVTASEMVSWNHSSAEVYKSYLDDTVDFKAVDKDGNELAARTYTVEELEAMTDIISQEEIYGTSANTWEGLNFWQLIMRTFPDVAGIEDPITITVTAKDGFSVDAVEKAGLDWLVNGVKDGEKRVPILLAYALDGYPLASGGKGAGSTTGEGYDSIVDNKGGPMRLMVHNTQGACLLEVVSVVVKVGEAAPVEAADFTVASNTFSKAKTFSVDQLRQLGATEKEYTSRGVTDKVRGVSLEDLLSSVGITFDGATFTIEAGGYDGKGTYKNISLKTAKEQEYFVAYDEFDNEANEWKAIDDTAKTPNSKVRIYRNYTTPEDDVWYNKVQYITGITVTVPEITEFDVFPGTSQAGQLPLAGLRATAMDKDGNVWIGTYGGGAAFKAKDSDQFVVYNKASDPALETTFVSSICPDAEGGVYMTQNASYTDPTANRGVAYMKDGNIEYIRAEEGKLPSDYVQEIRIDKDGIVWFGSDKGLTRYDPKAGIWQSWGMQDGFPAESIDNIEFDKDGGIWCGFYPESEASDGSKPFTGGFAYFKDGSVVKSYTYTSVADANTGAYRLGDVWIRDIAVDKNGGAWIVASGSYGGMKNTGGRVYYVSAPGADAAVYTGFELFGEDTFTKDSELRMVTVDPDGGLWFGTSKDGVFYVKDPAVTDGKLALTEQYASATGSWASKYDNIYSLDFHGNTLYAGSSDGLATHEFTFENGGGDEPGTEPTGDATAEDAALTITGDALARDGYFSIKGIKNWDGINKLDATFHTKNSAGTEEDIAVQGATLENIFNVVGLAEGAEIDSVDIYSADGKKITYTSEKALGTSLDGNKAMFIWTEGTAKVQKVVVGQFEEGESNKGLWAKDAIKIVVNAKSGDEPGTEPTGDATAEDAALTITGDALSRDGYFSIKGIKNWDGINKLDATFHTKNSAGTEEDIAVQGATLENIFNVVGLAEGAEIDSVDIYSADGKKITYTSEKALGTSLDGNKAMFIWTEGTAKVQKVVVGQFEEGESNKGLWAKDAIKIVVNAKTGGGDEPVVDPAAVADEIGDLPQTVTVDDKEAIEKARADFDALTDEQKAELPAGTEEKLQAAEAKLEAAEARVAAEEAQQQAAAAEQAAAEARAAQAEAEQAAAESQAAQAAAEEAAANAQAAQAAAEEAAAKAQAAQAEAEAKQAEAEAAQAAAEQAAQEATTGSAELVSAISELANTVVDAASAGYTAAKYTADTYKPYAEALEAAKAVMQKAGATVSEMKAANDKLAAAKAALVKKSANTLTAKGRTIKIKKKTIKKKTLKYAAKKAFTVRKAQGTVTYKKTKGNKKITVAKNGKITVKKGLKKGTYKIKVKVTAAGNDNYLAGSKTVTVTIKVK